MERIATLIPVSIASCFVLSAAFTFGELLGLGHFGLAWYLTISDFVNWAPATLALYGALLISTGVDHSYEPIGAPWWFGLSLSAGIALLDCVVAGVSTIFGWLQFTALVGVLGASLLFIGLYAAIPVPVDTENKMTPARALRVLIVLAYSIFCLGIMFGDQNWGPSHTYIVKTLDGSITAAEVFPIDRGVAIIEGRDHVLIPWNRIISIKGSGDMGQTDLISSPSCPHLTASNTCDASVRGFAPPKARLNVAKKTKQHA
jgi:hypothetical protein